MLSHSPPAGFIAPCLPTPILRPPSGALWVHEVKHDGYRMIAWRDGNDVRLYNRRGDDWSERYRAVVIALRALRVKTCLIDGELVIRDESGVSSYERLHSRQHDHAALLYAFDLLALDGQDLRRETLETRKTTLASLLRKSPT